MTSYISNEPFILQQKGIESIIFDPKDYGFDFYGDMLFTSSKLAKSNPELVDKFRKASLKGGSMLFLISKRVSSLSKQNITLKINPLKHSFMKQIP